VSESKGQPSPWDQLKNQIFLGGEKIEKFRRRRISLVSSSNVVLEFFVDIKSKKN
jgi:hypothetical protein